MSFKKKRILIGVLNWGLGHAVRCVPLIRYLQTLEVEVFIASDGQALAVLRQEFPEITCLELPAYRIRYPTENMIWNLFWQLPRLWKALRLERLAIANIIQKYEISGFISDNRYGFYAPDLPSAFITHQLHIRIGWAWLEKSVRWLNYRLIRRFGECWVPDDKDLNLSLSGELSHPAQPLEKVSYLGGLSRLCVQDTPILEKSFDLLVLLSGLEPQRGIFEQILWKQAVLRPDLRIVWVRGLPLQTADYQTLSPVKHIQIWEYADAQTLARLVRQSATILARSGYSTLMDLQKIGCAGLILVPTPGQTEQEYLANFLQAQKIAFSAPQKRFDLNFALSQALDYQGFTPQKTDQPFRPILEAFVQKL